jgi:thiosulfate reductase/polysulfide reductase chain A
MSNLKKLTRRSFLKTTALGAAAISISPALLEELNATPVKSVEQDFYTPYEKGKWTHTVCNMCFWTCGIKVKTVNGIVKKIDGIPEHPLNNGKICAKGNSGISALYDENRLKYPLIRVGKKGENRWKKVSWDEAFQYIVSKLKPVIENEPENIHLTSHGHGGASFKYLLRAMGSRNIYAASWTQ